MFVQDFARVDRPLDQVIDAFEKRVVPRLGDLVRDSWRVEEAGDADVARSPVAASVGPRRARPDGVVYAIAWPADGTSALPEFDADLELAALSPTCTHLELSGQGRFASIERWSDSDRHASRRTMAALAVLLAGIAETIAAGDDAVT